MFNFLYSTDANICSLAFVTLTFISTVSKSCSGIFELIFNTIQGVSSNTVRKMRAQSSQMGSATRSIYPLTGQLQGGKLTGRALACITTVCCPWVTRICSSEVKTLENQVEACWVIGEDTVQEINQWVWVWSCLVKALVCKERKPIQSIISIKRSYWLMWLISI